MKTKAIIESKLYVYGQLTGPHMYTEAFSGIIFFLKRQNEMC